jgi:hypothetical protein
VYYFARAAVTNDHRLGGLGTTEMHSSTALEVRSVRSRCQQGWGVKGESVHASLLASDVAGNPKNALAWLAAASL